MRRAVVEVALRHHLVSSFTSLVAVDRTPARPAESPLRSRRLPVARPGAVGNCALAGHRDTHFAFLKELEPGEVLVLETADGAVHRFRVGSARVVHESETWVLDPEPGRILTLVTCHPFDAVIPGGAMRYVVRAVGPTPASF